MNAKSPIVSTAEFYFESFKLDNWLDIVPLKNAPDSRIIVTGTNSYVHNNIFIKSDHPDIDKIALIRELQDLKKSLNGLPVTMWLTTETKIPDIHKVFSRHFQSSGTFYGMLLDLSQVNDSTFPQYSHRITVEEVKSNELARHFADILDKVFRCPNVKALELDWTTAQFTRESPPDSLNYVAFADGIPAGISSLIVDKEYTPYLTGGFYADGVLSEFRKLGIATAMGVRRVRTAQALGMQHVSTVLMSDVMARGYYERLGFVDVETMIPYFL